MGKVMTTKNYDMFEVHEVNRNPKQGKQNYLLLEASMLKVGWRKRDHMVVYPPDRRGKMTIVTGHTRFGIAKKHGLEIPYLIDEQRTPIHEVEAGGGNPAWSLEDWITSYTKLGKNESYLILTRFQQKTRIPMSTCLDLFMAAQGKQVKSYQAEVRDGTLRIIDTSFAETIGAIVMYCDATLGVPFARKSGFVRAVCLTIRAGVTDPETLMKRFKSNISVLKRKRYNPDYIQIVNEAYNYRHYPKIDFRTEIDNALAEEKRARMTRISREIPPEKRSGGRKKREAGAVLQDAP